MFVFSSVFLFQLYRFTECSIDDAVSEVVHATVGYPVTTELPFNMKPVETIEAQLSGFDMLAPPPDQTCDKS
jgi:hypothetical protein